MIFESSGSTAGASLAHSHSFLFALPIIPGRVSEEIKGSLNYYKSKDRCVFCDIVAQESEEERGSYMKTTTSSPFHPSPPAFPSKHGYSQSGTRNPFFLPNTTMITSQSPTSFPRS